MHLLLNHSSSSTIFLNGSRRFYIPNECRWYRPLFFFLVPLNAASQSIQIIDRERWKEDKKLRHFVCQPVVVLLSVAVSIKVTQQQGQVLEGASTNSTGFILFYFLKFCIKKCSYVHNRRMIMEICLFVFNHHTPTALVFILGSSKSTGQNLGEESDRWNTSGAERLETVNCSCNNNDQIKGEGQTSRAMVIVAGTLFSFDIFYFYFPPFRPHCLVCALDL